MTFQSNISPIQAYLMHFPTAAKGWSGQHRYYVQHRWSRRNCTKRLRKQRAFLHLNVFKTTSHGLTFAFIPSCPSVYQPIILCFIVSPTHCQIQQRFFLMETFSDLPKKFRPTADAWNRKRFCFTHIYMYSMHCTCIQFRSYNRTYTRRLYFLEGND